MLSIKAAAALIPPLFLKLSDIFSAHCLKLLSSITRATAFRISSSPIEESRSPAPSSSVLLATASCSGVCGNRITYHTKDVHFCQRFRPAAYKKEPSILKGSEVSKGSHCFVIIRTIYQHLAVCHVGCMAFTICSHLTASSFST